VGAYQVGTPPGAQQPVAIPRMVPSSIGNPRIVRGEHHRPEVQDKERGAGREKEPRPEESGMKLPRQQRAIRRASPFLTGGLCSPGILQSPWKVKILSALFIAMHPNRLRSWESLIPATPGRYRPPGVEHQQAPRIF